MSRKTHIDHGRQFPFFVMKSVLCIYLDKPVHLEYVFGVGALLPDKILTTSASCKAERYQLHRQNQQGKLDLILCIKRMLATSGHFIQDYTKRPKHTSVQMYE